MRRYEALDSLRGICACGVVFYHFNAPGWLCGSPVARGGEMFVDFFFVLSGFVIAASYGQRLREGFSLGRFMGLRFGRVYPLHLAMLLVFVAMELVALVKPSLSPRPPFTGARSLQHLADNVFLLEATGLSGGPSWNTPSWSICVEFWTYLIAALVLRFSGRWLWPVLGALMAGAAWQLAHGDHYLLDTVSLGVQRCVLGFGCGMIGYALHRRIGEAVGGFALASLLEIVVVAAALMVIGAAGVAPDHATPVSFAGPPLFMVLLIIYAAEKGAISRLLLSAPARLLGTLSYSIYMVHLFVMGRLLDVLKVLSPHFGGQIVQPDGHGGKMIQAAWYVGDGWTLVLLALVLPAAWIGYHYVEVPARALSRRLVDGKRPVAHAVPVEG